MNFVRNHVRLNCDGNTAAKIIAEQSKISSWSTVVPKEINRASQNHIQWVIEVPAEMHKEAPVVASLDFYLMSCTESTEYCTEVHLITKGHGEDGNHLNQFSKELLEHLRFHFNKSWVIQDKDLTLSSLKRSR